MAAVTLSLVVVAVAAVVVIALVWVTGLGGELARIAAGEGEPDGGSGDAPTSPHSGEDPS